MLSYPKVCTFVLMKNSPSETRPETEHKQDQGEAGQARTWCEFDKHDHEDTECKDYGERKRCEGREEPDTG